MDPSHKVQLPSRFSLFRQELLVKGSITKQKVTVKYCCSAFPLAKYLWDLTDQPWHKPCGVADVPRAWHNAVASSWGRKRNCLPALLGWYALLNTWIYFLNLVLWTLAAGCFSPILVGLLHLWVEMKGGEEKSPGVTITPAPCCPSHRYLWIQHHPSASPLFGLVDAPHCCYWKWGGSATHFGRSRNNSLLLEEIPGRLVIILPLEGNKERFCELSVLLILRDFCWSWGCSVQWWLPSIQSETYVKASSDNRCDFNRISDFKCFRSGSASSFLGTTWKDINTFLRSVLVILLPFPLCPTHDITFEDEKEEGRYSLESVLSIHEMEGQKVD